MENLFFGVFPDAETARDIHAYAQGLQAEYGFPQQLIAPERLHVTIAFLGETSELPDTLAASVSHAAGLLRHAPFVASFDQVKSFKGRARRPLVLTSDDGDRGLHILRDKLFDAFDAFGVDVPKTDFTPHITLSRAEAAVPPQAAGRFSFEVRELVLIRSLVDQQLYVPIKRWTLIDK